MDELIETLLASISDSVKTFDNDSGRKAAVFVKIGAALYTFDGENFVPANAKRCSRFILAKVT